MGSVTNIESLESLPSVGPVIAAFGVFDGVHKGHMKIIDSAKESATKKCSKSCILTFDDDPDAVFGKDGFKRLMSNEKRIRALCDTGVDSVVVLPFAKDIMGLEPILFLDAVIAGLGIEELHVGVDIRFGKFAKGDIDLLQEWGRENGVEICAHDLLLDDGRPIKSTRIRDLLKEGKIMDANQELGHPYTFSGEVVHGRGEGTDMGFATANLKVHALENILQDGVYAGICYVDDTPYKAAISVGMSPTFLVDAGSNVEVHILDFSGDIYGKDIEVEVHERLAPLIKFDDKDELIKTVMGYIQWTRDNIVLPKK